MAKLTTKSRNALSEGAFALPGRRYPINDPSHARNALARVSQHGSSSEKSRVRAAVHRKFPSIGHPSQMGGSTHLSADSMKFEAMKGRSQNAAIKRDFSSNLHYACTHEE